jgi:hypothetical protein
VDRAETGPLAANAIVTWVNQASNDCFLNHELILSRHGTDMVSPGDKHKWRASRIGCRVVPLCSCAKPAGGPIKSATIDPAAFDPHFDM